MEGDLRFSLFVPDLFMHRYDKVTPICFLKLAFARFCLLEFACMQTFTKEMKFFTADRTRLEMFTDEDLVFVGEFTEY